MSSYPWVIKHGKLGHPQVELSMGKSSISQKMTRSLWFPTETSSNSGHWKSVALPDRSTELEQSRSEKPGSEIVLAFLMSSSSNNGSLIQRRRCNQFQLSYQNMGLSESKVVQAEFPWSSFIFLLWKAEEQSDIRSNGTVACIVARETGKHLHCSRFPSRRRVDYGPNLQNGPRFCESTQKAMRGRSKAHFCFLSVERLSLTSDIFIDYVAEYILTLGSCLQNSDDFLGLYHPY